MTLCAGNSSGHGEFPAQRPVTRSFDVFIDLRLDKQLSKQSGGWWFETLSCPLWRHRNDVIQVNTYRFIIICDGNEICFWYCNSLRMTDYLLFLCLLSFSSCPKIHFVIKTIDENPLQIWPVDPFAVWNISNISNFIYLCTRHVWQQCIVGWGTVLALNRWQAINWIYGITQYDNFETLQHWPKPIQASIFWYSHMPSLIFNPLVLKLECIE